MNGEEIKARAKAAGVHLWKISDALGYPSDSAFSRKLRYDFSPEDTKRILEIIEELKAKRA